MGCLCQIEWGGGRGLPPVFIFRYWDTAGMMWWFLMRCRAEPGCCQSHREKEWLRESKVATWCSGNQFCLSFSVPLINLLLLPHNWITKTGLLFFSPRNTCYVLDTVCVSLLLKCSAYECVKFMNSMKKGGDRQVAILLGATANQHSSF